MEQSLYEFFAAALPGVRVLPAEPMARHTSFRIGGPAEVMVCPAAEDELLACLALCRAEGIRPRILGGGTNILAPDGGIPGVVVLTRGLDSAVRISDLEIEAGCGLSLGGGIGGRALGRAGAEGEHHHQDQKQGDQFLHSLFPPN